MRRALALVHEGALDEGSVDALAARLGIGPRHLHRLFVAHVGAPPLAVAKTRRLHFAKRLIDETDLSMTEIAFASGFGSLRRFNHTFRETYERAPSALRRLRRKDSAPVRGETSLRLAFRPPYDLAHLLGFLAARAIPGVERVDAEGYARTVALASGPAVVRVGAAPGRHALVLRVQGAPASALLQLTGTARRVFDLAADPALIGAALRPDPLLSPLVRRRPGLRVPGAWDAFECAVRAVLGQQVSVEAGRTLVRRLVARAGTTLPRPMDGLTHLFPSPAAVAGADLSGLGLTSARSRALKALAQAVADGRLDLRAPVDEVVAGLVALPGIGDWTAQYVALRAFGEPDAFPAADLVLRKAAAEGGPPLTARAARDAGGSVAPLAGLCGVSPLGCFRGAPRPRLAAPQGRVTMRYDEIESPVGPLLVAADDAGLRLIHFQAGPAPRRPDAAWRRDGLGIPRARPPARRVLRPRASRVRPHARARGHAVPARDVAGPGHDPVRHHDLLRRSGEPRGEALGLPGRGGRERAEPAAHRRSLPPGHRQGRLADRFWRRAPGEAGAARARRRSVRGALQPARAPLRAGAAPQGRQRFSTATVICSLEGGFSSRPRVCSTSWMTSASARSGSAAASLPEGGAHPHEPAAGDGEGVDSRAAARPLVRAVVEQDHPRVGSPVLARVPEAFPQRAS